MGRNRFVSSNADVNRFRSNLMLLVHNLHVEGIPFSKLQAEYKKFFQENVSAESMTTALELFSIGGLNKGCSESEMWSRVFNNPCLYEFFSVEEVIILDKEKNPRKESIIKCRRGRTVVEMLPLAKLAEFANIENLRAKGKRKGRDEECDCNSTCEQSIHSDPNNPLKRKLVTEDKEDMNDKITLPHLMSPPISDAETPESLPLPDVSKYISQTQLNTAVKKRVGGSGSRKSARLQLQHAEAEPATFDVSSHGNKEGEDSNIDNIPTACNNKLPEKTMAIVNCRENCVVSSTETDDGIATVVLKNYKGEIKTVSYAKARSKCTKCDKPKPFPNENPLSRQNTLCSSAACTGGPSTCETITITDCSDNEQDELEQPLSGQNTLCSSAACTAGPSTCETITIIDCSDNEQEELEQPTDRQQIIIEDINTGRTFTAL